MPVHAHIMVAGWLMSAVFGFFYHLFPVARQNKLAPIHFWMHAVGIVVLVDLALFRSGGKSGRGASDGSFLNPVLPWHAAVCVDCHPGCQQKLERRQTDICQYIAQFGGVDRLPNGGNV